jgi:hypothetical protein
MKRREPIENVPAWGNAGQILTEIGVEWEYVIVDQITKGNWFTGRIESSDGLFYHFMVGTCEVAQWCPVFNKIFFFESHRKWAEQFIAKCRHLGYRNPLVYSYIKS